MEKKKRNLFGIIAILIVLIIIVGPFRFNSSSICSLCGVIRNSSARQLPLIQITYWQSHAIAETPLSRTVESSGILGTHQHQWLFSNGGGNGIMCALGNGRFIRPAASSENAAKFLGSLAKYEEKETAEKWLNLMLTPHLHPYLHEIFLMQDFPPEGFGSAAEFKEWFDPLQAEVDSYMYPDRDS